MWSPSQITRTGSSHSVALSIGSIASSTSSQNSLYLPHPTSTPDTNYSDRDNDDESILSAYQEEKPQPQSPQQLRPVAFNLDEMPLWNPRKRTLTLNSREHFMVAAKQHDAVHQTLEMQRKRSESVTSVDTHATLAEEEDVHDVEMDLKTPTVARHRLPTEEVRSVDTVGPMSHLLHSLLLRVVDVERAQATVMADDYAALQKRVAELERENQMILKSHNDLLALRNDDLMNLIKVRDLLAEERREHAAIRKLRDDDLENVLALREKLAKATWSGKMQIATSPPQEKRSFMGGGAMTPILPHRISRPDSDDLWQQAKTAAMEQRVLELEKANASLRAAQSAATMKAPESVEMMSRMENMFEDSLRQRERMATRVQQLRSEKDGLQKELANLEDRNSELEALVERLKRSVQVDIGQ
ncbi:hypothetical protein A1O7_09057 [Cladophialophora yegresii CBS 114405]|uniref:Uncharacterized protein n=1 Tax=Cladophialophora yegresii CBS 114405 TaxID=1182544 RepID=W9VVB2_9EURO|nr:uncharacterized protein A1O7_09057 [Cladophialophora yegresii CBS 114405]EXJ56126.1 hypothetical protein A1O7_09057 [Cladophialophora yegresii CBS 114405]